MIVILKDNKEYTLSESDSKDCQTRTGHIFDCDLMNAMVVAKKLSTGIGVLGSNVT